MSSPTLNVSTMFLKILEISYNIKATMRREIEFLVINIPETDVVYILFPVHLKVLSQDSFFKFAFEARSACVS